MEYFNTAPPSTITIATGPKGGAYESFAQQYRKKLARAHVTLNIRITDGTLENIRLLEDPKSGVQVAFVVGGASNSQQAPGLLSLGRVNYQVFWIFYRGAEILEHVTQLKGKRIGVGPESFVSMQVLRAAGVNSESATLLPLTGSAAVGALVASENLDSCVSMVQSAKDRMRNNASEPLDWACAGRILPKRNVNSYFIVIGAVFRKNLPKVLFAEND